MLGYNLLIDCIVFPFFFITEIFGIKHQIPNINPYMLFFTTIAVSPIIETLIGQMLPILIIRHFIKSSWIILVISAIIFTVPHSIVDISRAIPSFLCGILLAFSFLHWLKISINKAYWVTWAIHFLHNGIIMSPFLFMKDKITAQTISNLKNFLIMFFS